MATMQPQPDRLDAAAAALEAMADGGHAKGGIAEAVEHFRRSGKLSGGGDGGGRVGPRQPYQEIEAVYRCVNFAASSVACMPLMVGTDRDELIASGPIADLLDQPNPDQSMGDVVQETIGWLLLSGRAYWLFAEMTGGRPTQIVAVGGGQIRPRYAGQGGPTVAPPRRRELIGWWFRPAGHGWPDAEAKELEAVWPIKLPNFDPDRPHDGLSVPDVVRRKINQVWKADSANELSLDNNMQFGGIISPDEPVTPDQWDAFVAHLREQYEGHRKRNRPLLSSRKLSIESSQNTFSEMEFSELLDRSVASICVGFGFDPAAVGYPPQGGRFEYVKQAKQSAWIDTILPLAAMIAGHFDRGVLSRFEGDRSATAQSQLYHATRQAMTRSQVASYGWRRALKRKAEQRRRGRLIAWFDDSDIPAVREARLQLAKEGATFIETYKQPPADVIELFDIGLPVYDWQKTGWQVMNELPIDRADAELDQPPASGSNEENDAPESEASDAGSDDASGSNEDSDAAGGRATNRRAEPSGAGAEGKRLTAAQLDRIQDSWWRSWQPLRRQLERKISGHFGRLRREVLGNLNRLDPAQRAVGRKDLVTELLFDVTAAKADMLRVTGPVIREAFRFGGEQIARQNADADGDDQPVASPFDIESPEVGRAIRQRLNMLQGVDDTVFARLQEDLAEMTEQGATIPEMGERIRQRFGIASRRARNIAQTEVGAAIEKANHLAREQTGVELKSWLSSRKAQARQSHLAVEQRTMAEPIAIDERFEVPPSANSPGGAAMHPRDAALPVGDVVNCACTVISRFPGDGVRDARHLQAMARKGWLDYSQSRVQRTPAPPQPKDTDNGQDDE